jgi:hypothetical protein
MNFSFGLMICAALSLCDLAAAAAPAKVNVRFDDAKAGEPPPGWTLSSTGKGNPKWTIELSEHAPSKPHVLKQSGGAPFPLAVKNDLKIQNGFVSVKFKPLSGDEDQAGGVVWRFKDSENYYVCRGNALEDNVVLYKVEQGKRIALDIVGRAGGYGVKERVPSGEWNTLRVDFAANKFVVTFNGKKLFEVEDGTFTEAGLVGLWTKADSVTLFDDFEAGQQ